MLGMIWYSLGNRGGNLEFLEGQERKEGRGDERGDLVASGMGSWACWIGVMVMGGIV